jgi:hypothetical protein
MTCACEAQCCCGLIRRSCPRRRLFSRDCGQSALKLRYERSYPQTGRRSALSFTVTSSSAIMKSIRFAAIAGCAAMTVASCVVAITAGQAEPEGTESTQSRTAPDPVNEPKRVRTIVVLPGQADRDRMKAGWPPAPHMMTEPPLRSIAPASEAEQGQIDLAQPPQASDALTKPKRVHPSIARTDRPTEPARKGVGAVQPPKGTTDYNHSPSQKILVFGDGACSYRLRFDPRKESEISLGNTARLLFIPEDFHAPVVVWSDEEDAYTGFDFDEYRQRCTNAVRRLNEAPFVPLSGFEPYRRSLTDQVKDACEFQVIKMRGFSVPAALREYERASTCTRFIDALEGRTDTMTFFREFVDEYCKKNFATRLHRRSIRQESAHLSFRVWLGDLRKPLHKP